MAETEQKAKALSEMKTITDSPVSIMPIGTNLAFSKKYEMVLTPKSRKALLLDNV